MKRAVKRGFAYFGIDISTPKPLSPTAEFLFVHIPKNGGMTLRKSEMLRPRIVTATRAVHVSSAYSDAVLKTMTRSGDHHGYEHARLRDIKPEIRERYRPFAILRNPWSRVVSRYLYGLAAMEAGSQPQTYSAHSFEAFLEERHIWGNKPYYWHRAVRGWYPQLDYVVDESGEIRTDLLRLEKLTSEAQRYFGLAEPLPRRNVAKDKVDYKSYYTPAAIQIVADWYKADIDAFGFDFDTPATRGCLYAD